MNTPPTPKRHSPPHIPERNDGAFRSYIADPEAAAAFAKLVNEFVHLESEMKWFLAILLDDDDPTTASYVWNAILNPKSKSDLMQFLLEKAPANEEHGPEFDEIVTEFRAVSKIRNDFVHGQWWTRDSDGSLWLLKPKEDDHALGLAITYEIQAKELDEGVKRILALWKRCFKLTQLERERREERARQAKQS